MRLINLHQQVATVYEFSCRPEPTKKKHQVNKNKKGKKRVKRN